ncbi:unnamed protein product [Staurois parvus]|uniref:Uncharacterized protein n=1 Tax=Staurois parvus TaxID=386267 RepID=A0ABN9C710_9NEOB|nr:unnamed protein product [Staurois parvus]
MLIEQSLGGKLHILSLVFIAREFFFSWESALNAGSGESGYSECRVRGDRI